MNRIKKLRGGNVSEVQLKTDFANLKQHAKTDYEKHNKDLNEKNVHRFVHTRVKSGQGQFASKSNTQRESKQQNQKVHSIQTQRKTGTLDTSKIKSQNKTNVLSEKKKSSNVQNQGRQTERLELRQSRQAQTSPTKLVPNLQEEHQKPQVKPSLKCETTRNVIYADDGRSPTGDTTFENYAKAVQKQEEVENKQMNEALARIRQQRYQYRPQNKYAKKKESPTKRLMQMKDAQHRNQIQSSFQKYNAQVRNTVYTISPKKGYLVNANNSANYSNFLNNSLENVNHVQLRAKPKQISLDFSNIKDDDDTGRYTREDLDKIKINLNSDTDNFMDSVLVQRQPKVQSKLDMEVQKILENLKKPKQERQNQTFREVQHDPQPSFQKQLSAREISVEFNYDGKSKEEIKNQVDIDIERLQRFKQLLEHQSK